MKKYILLFALLFSVSSSFISCREPEERDVDDMEVTDDMDDMDDDMEDVGDEIEDEANDLENELDEN
ncbi:MAG: hypothetical protein WBL27_03775 [Salinimicrobium sp.]